MNDKITPDEAINECLKLGAQGISLGLAKQLQAERDALLKAYRAKCEELEAVRTALDELDKITKRQIYENQEQWRVAFQKKCEELEAMTKNFLES